MGGKKQHNKRSGQQQGKVQQNGFVAASGSPTAEKRSIGWKLVVAILAVAFGMLHRSHVAYMFESDRHFSYLSNLEREMSFRTEMGLYYSYFKELINAPTLAVGMKEIMQDNVTEYGHTINTLKRFNLYPEVLLAPAYRLYKWIGDSNKWRIEECWKTERGEGLDPIMSCEGMGNPFYFYINFAFLLAGTVTSSLFLYGVLLSDSIFGGFLVVACFFFNHGEATRVQWTPPLRESFGYPVFLAEMLLVSYILKYTSLCICGYRKTGTVWSSLVSILTVFFMLFWQFAQFALSTQVLALFGTYMLDYLPLKTFKTISNGLLAGFVVGFVLLFGNEMLLTSFFLSSVISVQLLFLLRPIFDKISLRVVAVLLQLLIFLAVTVGLKFFIGNALHIKDDAHIFEILASKFTDYNNFHTKLYTCAPEFGFMQFETIVKMTQTLLLPVGVAAFLLAVILIFRFDLSFIVWRRKECSPVYSEVVYNCIQLALFTIMSVLIMRLKLFFSPHLCIITALVASKKVLSGVSSRLNMDNDMIRIALCGLVIAGMAFKGHDNILQQWKIQGEYSNMPQEQLFHWVNTKTPKNAVFAGSMPVMANLKLSTGRPIVNHPHYEDEGIRQRTMNVYSIFSRKSHEEVFNILKEMQVNYLVFEFAWCAKGGRPGCSMPDMWDTVDIENRGKQPLCEKIHARQFGPFKLAFENKAYKVLQVLPVRSI